MDNFSFYPPRDAIYTATWNALVRLPGLQIQTDPPAQRYDPDITEPLEVDVPELLESRYGRQN